MHVLVAGEGFIGTNTSHGVVNAGFVWHAAPAKKGTQIIVISTENFIVDLLSVFEDGDPVVLQGVQNRLLA